MNKNTKSKIHQFFIRSLFFFVAILFVVCFAALPMVLNSAISAIIYPPSELVHPFTPADIVAAENVSKLRLHVVSLDEVNSKAKLRIHGYRYCTTECDAYEERVLFFDADKHSDTLNEAIPAYERVEMPQKSKEFTTEISLPMRGDVFLYPFDSYKLGIGVVVERKYPDGHKVILTPEETKGHLIMTIEDEMARVNLTALKEIDPKLVRPKKAEFTDYAYVRQMKFERPSYLIIVVMIVIILSLAVMIFTMFTRPFDHLIMNTSALVFGVWSIRSLLLTGYPSDITLLDTVLQVMVVFILMTLAFRGMNYFHRAGHMHIFPWAKAALSRECPECLADVSLHAKRCFQCSSPLPPSDPA